jgi:signal transduction histidine kinase
MGPAWIAPPDQLEAPYQLRTLVEVSAVRFVFLAGLAFSLFLFITWLADRSDRATLWMAVGFACLTAAGWSLATLGLPVPRPRTTWVGNGVMLAVVVSMTHRLLGISRPRLEAAFWVFAALALLSRVVVPEGATSELVRRVMLGPALLGGLYPLAVVLHAHATRPSLETTCLITTGLVFQIAALHDLGWYASFTPASHTGSLHLAIGVSLAGFGWLFVQRFVRALRSEEAVSRSLDARVREKELELDENYRRLAVLERERVIQDERTRLMEDLHDGLGGRISSALAQVQSGGAPRETVASSLRDAMHEMRILLHSLDRENAALSTLLGALRDPLEPLLESAGIRLRWQVEDVPDPAGYGPEMALHVVRIVQQAAVNAAEHSKARELRIATTTRGTGDDARVVILVEDDGIGLPAAPASAVNGRHHGLRNMQRRAERIGAELELAPAHPGTKLELRLPIGASSSGPPPAGPGAA